MLATNCEMFMWYRLVVCSSPANGDVAKGPRPTGLADAGVGVGPAVAVLAAGQLLADVATRSGPTRMTTRSKQ